MLEKHPRPVRGRHLLAPELFSQRVLEKIIEDNSGWLQKKARTTREVHNTLFPNYEKAGMGIAEIVGALNEAMLALGYLPSDETPNPLWDSPDSDALARVAAW